MVRSGWLKRFSEKMSTTFLSARSRNETRKRRLDAQLVQEAEYLEDRSLMSVSTLFLSGTGELAIELDSGESVRLSSVVGRVAVSTSVAGGPYVPDTSIGTVPSASVRSINILGGDEANTIDLSGVLAVDYSSLTTITIDAANGHDVLIGSPDIGVVLYGGDGDDTIQGGVGDDLLLGGDGHDSITAEAGDDNIQSGNGHDTVTAGDGNDLIDLGDGNDVANAGNGNDSIDGDDGQDSVDAGLGNDSLNGGMGDDTLIGNEGDDAITGGTDDDQIFGDSDNPAIIGIGADTVLGGAGDDAIIGGGGADILDGGSGSDQVASSPFVTTTSDPLPVPVANPDTGVPVALTDAVPTGLSTVDFGTFHTMTTGIGDGGLNISVDATGKFGSFSQIVGPNPANPLALPTSQYKGVAFEGAVFDPIGDGLGLIPDITSVESTVYFRFGDITGSRMPLDVAAQSQGTIGNVFGTPTESFSQFTIGPLAFELTQQVQPQFDLTTNQRIGSLMTQTYRIQNTGTTTSTFELVRYFDGDLNFDGRDGLGGTTSNANGVPDGASADGGGHFVNPQTRDEFLFETEQGGVSNAGTFVGITSTPNPAPPPAAFPADRFEIGLFPSLRTRLINGGQPTNQVTNDGNSDGSVDPGQEGNITLALRNTYDLQPGTGTIYTTHTVFGTGTPNRILLNRGPSTLPDGADPTDPNETNAPIVSLSDEPVTIDVVSNDTDLDGTLDFTSVEIADPPTKGIADPLGDGRIRYTPEPGTTGTFDFTYTVADNLGSRSIPTRVFVLVNPDPAADNLNGGLGNDTLIGGDGDDTMLGGGDNDSMFGGTGDDRVVGQGGSDSMVGGTGTDTVDGGTGHDSLASDSRSLPNLFINDVTVVEGAVTLLSDGMVTAEYTVTLDHPVERPVTFDFTAVSGTATSGEDFVAAAGTLTIPACETSVTILVTVLGDSLAELTENYSVVLSNLRNAQVGKAVGRGTILNNDLTLEGVMNASRLPGDQNQVHLSVNPTNPQNVVVVAYDRFSSAIGDGGFVLNANPSIFIATSFDGGQTWSDSSLDRTDDGVFNSPITPEARYSGSVAFDRAGNLHVVYIAEPNVLRAPFIRPFGVVVYGISRDGGRTFQTQVLTPRAEFNEKPWVAVGPDAQNPNLDAVYVTFHRAASPALADQELVVRGAQVPPAIFGLPPIQTPVPNFNLAGNTAVFATANFPHFAIPTVGPEGQLAITWETQAQFFTIDQGPSVVHLNFDANGLVGGLTFRGDQTVNSSNVGTADSIPATQPQPQVPNLFFIDIPLPPGAQAYASPYVAYDGGGSRFDGRLYLAYVDEQANESDNLDIYVRFSDDDGVTFSNPVRVNDDLGFNSQFMPSISVDQSNGVITMGWYDARNDVFGGIADTDGLVNTDMEYFVSASYDGGVTWLPSTRISGGSSNISRSFAFFGNYTGIAAAGGTIYAGWADNSNSTGDNPDGNFGYDAYVARLTEFTTGTASNTAFDSQSDPADLLLGGDGNDVLNGGDSADTLNGQGGSDRLFGHCDDDLLFGGAGLDTLSGGFGLDTLDGQGGADLLFGDADNDTYIWRRTSAGDDTVSGNSGLDTTSVLGTNGVDLVTVGQDKELLTVTFGSGGTLRVAHPGAVMSVVVNGLGGNDTLTVGNVDLVLPLVLSVDGGNGDDFVTAAGANLGGVRLALLGGIGNDKIHGSNGKDTIDGGAGNDSLLGFAGNDTILGDAGIDTIGGGLGNDSIDGGDGYDSLNGQEGDDIVMGGLGNDSLKGDDGNDTLSGGTGDDQLNGMAGNDSLLGSVGQDQLAGGTGNDTLDGGRDNDSLIGNTGNDRILGDHGADYINGGDGNNTINGGDGNDTILTGLGNDAVAGGDGSDYVNTDGGDDTLIGGDGNDTLLGGLGRDLILGRDGDDSINGQGGTDTLAGNQGVDIIVGDPSEINEAFSLLSLGANFLLNLGVTA